LLPHFSHVQCTSQTIDFVNFSLNDVREVICNLSQKSSPGPDGIPNVLLINLSKKLASPISIFFTFIFQTGAVPDAWKSAIVTPIF